MPVFMKIRTSAISQQACHLHRNWRVDICWCLAGQRVAPPPFNDRCVAVSGRCGGACQSWDTEQLQRREGLHTSQEHQHSNPRIVLDLIGVRCAVENDYVSCTADGYIEQAALVEHIPPFLFCKHHAPHGCLFSKQDQGRRMK